MKIAVISSTVFPCPPAGYAGLEQIAWEQAKGLASLGHQVALFAPDGSTCPGAQVVHFGPPGGVDEKVAYSRYWQALAQSPPDVVIDHTWQKWTFYGRREGWLKAPVLAWCHAPVDTMFKEIPEPGLLSFVCISDDQRAHFEALYNRPARTCHNGADENFYAPVKGLDRLDRFLFLARFSTIKGPDLAIRACLDAGAGLDVVGDVSITNEPALLEACRRMADSTSPGWDRKRGRQIRLVGPCSRGEAVWWFSRALALLHPNERFREPFGLAPVEAMMCGCPVIAWDNGAMRETVGGSFGMLVRSYEELVEAVRLAWREVWPDAAHSGFRDHALKFTTGRMVRRVEELCEEAVRRPW